MQTYLTLRKTNRLSALALVIVLLIGVSALVCYQTTQQNSYSSSLLAALLLHGDCPVTM